MSGGGFTAEAEAAVEEDEQAAMEARMRAGIFTFDDFLASYRMLRRMGPLQGVLKLVPGLGKQLQGVDVDEKQLARVEAIVLSMTPQERRLPHLISTPRRRRIAAGSGTSLDEVAAVPADIVYRIFGRELSMGKSLGLMGVVNMVCSEARQQMQKTAAKQRVAK